MSTAKYILLKTESKASESFFLLKDCFLQVEYDLMNMPLACWHNILLLLKDVCILLNAGNGEINDLTLSDG